MNQESRWYKFVMSLPFWWIVLTAIYLCLFYLNEFVFYLGNPQHITTLYWGYLSGLVGLFVPIGPWNALAIWGAFSNLFYYDKSFNLFLVLVALGLPLVLFTVFGGEWLLRKWKLPPVIKLLLIFSILFVLTIVVDLSIHGRWQSLHFLINHGRISL